MNKNNFKNPKKYTRFNQKDQLRFNIYGLIKSIKIEALSF